MQTEALFQAILTAFKTDDSGEASNEVQARALTDVLVAFAGVIAAAPVATVAAVATHAPTPVQLQPGELYAGVILGLDGQSDHHLVLLPGEAEGVTWAGAKEFAAKAGGELPTRREQALLYANLQREFKPNWYWSGEQHAAGDAYAWSQYFFVGLQYDLKSASLRARAVRRLPI